MKTIIHEIGVIDTSSNKHPVYFQRGLNVVTGKSSTGKSALIEIFDYCFGSNEYTVPKGVITDNAKIYYLCLEVDGQNLVLARRHDIISRAFLKKEEKYSKNQITDDYFNESYFIDVGRYRKHLKEFFLDFEDVDESLIAKDNRGRKAPTPSIRSFTSFMLQHQNLVANKHALFYRFDEKEKREQVIEHTKIFLGLVDQNFFLLSQERERLTIEQKSLKRQIEANKKASKVYEERVGPVLTQLYAMMGLENEPISLKELLLNPQVSKDELDKIIKPEKIIHQSDKLIEQYNNLEVKRATKTVEIRKLQRKVSSIQKHIKEEERLVNNINQFQSPQKVHIASTICPFCHTEHENLQGSAQKLEQAIVKVSRSLSEARPMKAKFESSLIKVNREIELLDKEIQMLSRQIIEIEQSEAQLAKQKNLYETILMTKARLFMLLESLKLADDMELEKQLNDLDKRIRNITKELRKYNVTKELNQASDTVNQYMKEIGKDFEFEDSYQPINLHFSFETFDLYHENDRGEKIYLRSMGSGANWLYSHVTLFLAMHKYFVELNSSCSIPSVLFLDQPTQVYFPNFRRDKSESFSEQKELESSARTKGERKIDEDIRAVENLFSQLSEYCNSIEESNGFSPQIIVTDHADDLKLSNGVEFENLVNGNRWRNRGLIDPVPEHNKSEIP